MYAFRQLRSYGFNAKTVFHVGGHWGQEAPIYKEEGVETAVFVEPAPATFARLREQMKAYPGYVALEALCTESEGQVVDFNVSSNAGASSSILSLDNFAAGDTGIHCVETLRLTSSTADGLAQAHFPDTVFDLLVLDTEGTEIRVLKGATNLLQKAKAAYIEVSEEPVHPGGCTFEEVTAYLRPFGLRLRVAGIRKDGWCNAMYYRP